MQKGKLIVFEGIDGSGKTTQIRLLAARLKKAGFFPVVFRSPARKTFFGKIIDTFLKGRTRQKFSSEELSLLFALDRYQAKKKMLEALAAGKIVIWDRYKYSTLAYQTALMMETEQESFLSWVETLEQRMPVADLVLFLDVPAEAAVLQEKKEVFEKKIEFQKKVFLVYQKLSEKYGFLKIECLQNARLKAKEEIAAEVWKRVKQILC